MILWGKKARALLVRLEDAEQNIKSLLKGCDYIRKAVNQQDIDLHGDMWTGKGRWGCLYWRLEQIEKAVLPFCGHCESRHCKKKHLDGQKAKKKK